jgi:hypothetical protein
MTSINTIFRSYKQSFTVTWMKKKLVRLVVFDQSANRDTFVRHCSENPIYGFPERNCAASVPISTFMCLWAVYIFPVSVHILFCSRICRPSVEIYKSLTDTWMWKLGLRPCNSFSGNTCFEFSLLCLCSVHKVAQGHVFTSKSFSNPPRPRPLQHYNDC